MVWEIWGWTKYEANSWVREKFSHVPHRCVPYAWLDAPWKCAPGAWVTCDFAVREGAQTGHGKVKVAISLCPVVIAVFGRCFWMGREKLQRRSAAFLPLRSAVSEILASAQKSHGHLWATLGVVADAKLGRNHVTI